MKAWKWAASAVAALGLLALGMVPALATPMTDPTQPVLTATASGTAPNCSYTVTASVSGYPGASDPYAPTVVLGGSSGPFPGAGAGSPTEILGDGSLGVPLTSLNPNAIWSETTTTPGPVFGNLRLELNVSQIPMGGSGYALVSTSTLSYLGYASTYSGSCAPAPTPSPTPTASATPTVAPAAPPTASASPSAGVGAIRSFEQATPSPTPTASSTATASPTASASASPTPTLSAGLASVQKSVPPSDALWLIVIGFVLASVLGVGTVGVRRLRSR